MYTCLIGVGAFVGLAFLPVFLALYGPLPPRGETGRLHDYKDDGEAEEGEGEGGEMRTMKVQKTKKKRKEERKPREKKE
jgi:hypothetical protein